jgi:hypothetical protein
MPKWAICDMGREAGSANWRHVFWEKTRLFRNTRRAHGGSGALRTLRRTKDLGPPVGGRGLRPIVAGFPVP